MISIYTVHGYINVICSIDDFTGNHTITNQAIDYYTSHEHPNEVFIPAGTTQIEISVKVEDDRRLEDYELFRIITGPPDLPEGKFPCATDVIIRDDDGKLLH